VAEPLLDSPATEPPPTAGVPRWVRWSSLALALVGLAVSAYLTIEHYTTPALLACPETGVIDCGKVTTSPESELFGVPVALLGLLFFVPVVGLMTPWAWRRPRLDLVRLAALGGGVVMVGWLVYAELFRIEAICLWCTVVHVVTVSLFAVVLLGQAAREEPL
jgi:uncharacterized membrane protein